MSSLKIITALCLVGITFSSSYADEMSRKACETFLPAFGDQNIDLINNGFRRDYPETEKGGKNLFGILKSVSDSVSAKSQERCDKGIYPIMDLGACYDSCKVETGKAISGSFAWNVQDRTHYTNLCYSACTGAYVAQSAITKTLRKVASDATQCAASLNVFDSNKSKEIESILMNVEPSANSALSK